MTETIVLDPVAAIPAGVTRTQVDITHFIGQAGPAWGDADSVTYKAQSKYGERMVDHVFGNRQAVIPLILKGPTFSTIRLQVQQKVGLWQNQGGWIMRQVGATPLYAEVVTSILHLGGSLLQAYKGFDADAVLTIEYIPEWFGNEITLDALTGTGTIIGPIKLSGSNAVIGGNYPGRVRIVVSDTSGNNRRRMIWGLRSQNYDSAATAALFYEAEALTPLNGAASAALTGASGGNAVTYALPTAGSWTPFLSFAVAASGQMTHRGKYRIWARVYSPAATGPTLRLLWGIGSLAVPITNDAVQIPGASNFYLVDLGEVSLQPLTTITSHRWQAVIQGNPAVSTNSVSVDCIYLQPLDEYSGRLQSSTYVDTLGTVVTKGGATGADDSTVGQIAWANPTNVSALDGTIASVFPFGEQGPKLPTAAVSQNPDPTGFNQPYVWSGPAGVIDGGGGGQATTSWDPTNGGISQSLAATGFGFSIPTGATITGIKVTASVYGSSNSATILDRVSLYKAGSLISDVESSGIGVGTGWQPVWTVKTYGGANYLWGTTWTPAQINASNFGVALSCGPAGPSFSGAFAEVDWIEVTIYYTIQSHFLKATGFGFTIPSGAIIAGISATTYRRNALAGKPVTDARVSIIKGGVIQSGDKSSPSTWAGTLESIGYGSSSDLWGTTWAYTDVNASTFGIAFSCQTPGGTVDNGGSGAEPCIDYIAMTVYYTLSGSFVAPVDAVTYANQSTEIATTGITRADPGALTGPVSQLIGDLPRLPQSGLESQTCELFVKPYRGSPTDDTIDTGLDTAQAQVFYRPSFLYVGE